MDLPNFKNLTYKNIKIVYERNQVWLYKDNNLLTYECLKNFNDLNTFQLHFDIAYGHCVTAGLGLLITESTLLKCNKIKKLTVLEIDKNIIDIQKKLNPDLMSQLNVIHCDANTYKCECDCLFLDHSLDQLAHSFHYDVTKKEKINLANQCYKNIKHKKFLWFRIIQDNSYEEYLLLRKKFDTLPLLTKKEYIKYETAKPFGRKQ